jgi:hypothetical protein
MENREQQILSEIKSMMGTIRTQLELLDAKMAELQQCVDPEDFDNNPIELELEDIAVEETVVLQPEILEADDDLPFDDVPEAQPEPAPAPAVEEDDDDDLPGVFDQPLSVFEAAQNSPKLKPSVADVMVAEMQAWRTDMPGTPVKDVRSAISLNDRIIFINYLFGEDPLTFQNTITQINTMTTLDQVVDYVKTEFPEWDLNSELVYRFMMAVRRRVK